MQGSYSHPYIEHGAEWIAGFLPEDTVRKADDAADQAGEKMNETRQRLEEMDILKDMREGYGEKETNADDKPPEEEEGYKPDQREQLDDLSEESQTPPGTQQ